MKKLSISLNKVEAILGVIYIFIQLLILPIIVELVNLFFRLSLSEVELNFICFAINFISITVIFRNFLVESTKCALHEPFSILKTVGIGLILYFASSMVVSFLILYLDPEFSNANDNNIAGMLDDNYVLMAVSVILLAPITEEILYRSVMFGLIYKKHPIFAFVITAVIFSALHVVGYIKRYPPMRLLLCFFQYLPPSIVLAWTYIKADNIWSPILVHTIINTLGILSM